MNTENKIVNRLIYFFIILNFMLAGIYIIKYLSIGKEAERESQLLNEIQVGEDELRQADKEAGENAETTVENGQQNALSNEMQEEKDNPENSNIVTERMLQVEELQKENEDIVGWIEIKDTNISYPVLQGEDNEYYLNHNYKGETTQKGSIFLTKDYDWSLPSTNLLIYGHNIMYGQMFQDLLKYADEDFYKEHPVIRFTTEKEDAEYEIISAFKARVYYKSEENVFRYYNFINAETEEEYNEFVENAKIASLYETQATAEFGDQLITLITCSYHTEDGRFVVVGRKNDKST